MRSGVRVAAIGGIGILTAVVTAACGSAGGSNASSSHSPAASGFAGGVQAVQAAYRTTMSQQTAAFRITAAIQSNGPGGSPGGATFTGSGQVDLATNAFTMSMNVPTVGVLKLLLAHGVEYIQMPAAERSQIPGQKAWVSVNLNKVTQAELGKSFSQLSSAGNDNPTQVLSQLAAVSSGVSKVGSATVAGVPATEYRATVNLNKVASQVQAKDGAQAAQAIRQEEKEIGTSTLPIEVWIGAHHLVRQLRYHVPIPAASTGGSSGSGTVTATMTFTSYGVPVHLTPPSASQTTDITSEVLQQAKASSAG